MEDEPQAGPDRWSGSPAVEAWAFARSMVDDMTAMVLDEAETELELLDGLRVVARATALCQELSLDVDGEAPWFFPMNSEARFIGGPNPDGDYRLAMVDGSRRFRVEGQRGTSAYLGFQVLAGVGLTPRRMAAYLSDRDLVVDGDGSFAFVLAADEPTAAELDGATWLPVPADSSAIVVRQYVADPATEVLASFTISPLDPIGAPPLPTADQLAEQFTAMGWTIVKLTTLHKTIKPELLDLPNVLRTEQAGALGDAETTPDNLYVIGTFRLAPDEALVVDLDPPEGRYWSVTVETIWHECIDPRRRPSSTTNARATRRPDGTARLVVSATDPGVDGATWLDTGGRHRGFVVVRWLDNPDPPGLATTVVPVAAVADLPALELAR